MATYVWTRVQRWFNGDAGAHAGTVRWAYTVPAGCQARLREYFIQLWPHAAGAAVGTLALELRINGTGIANISNGLSVAERQVTWGGCVLLFPGDVVDCITANGAAVTCRYSAGALFDELV